MNKRKGFILGGALLASAAALCALAYGSGVFRKNALGTQAVAYNSVDFEIRNDGYTYTSAYTRNGLELDVTDGSFTDWKFCVTNWGISAPKHVSYTCSFTLTLNVNGRDAGGNTYSCVDVEVGLGDGEGGTVDSPKKWNFAAGEEFTVTSTFTPHTGKDSVGVHLRLGALRDGAVEPASNAFHAKVREFKMIETESEEVVHHVNFESAEGFINRWKTSHDAGNFCTNKATVEPLIEDYCALRPAERALITGDFQNLTGKVINEPAAEASASMKSNAWVAGEGNEAHAEVSVKSTEAWHSRIWIDLSHLGLETGKTYKLSFDIWKKDVEAGFELITQPLKWTNDVNDRYGFFDTTGYKEQEITIPSGGSLWFLAQLGNVVNEISVYNIAVRSLELDVDGKSSIIESVRYFANRYNIELGA